MLYIFVTISIIKFGLIKSITVNEFLEDTTTYINEICSHNGIPKFDEKTKKIICTCDDKYANEPREKYKKYINGQLIQCSYRKKRRFLTFFLAGISPFGLDYFYLGHYPFFFLILFINILSIVFNIISFVLNYKLTKKNEEIKRQNKLQKANKKFNFQNIKKINKSSLYIFTKITQILTFFNIFFWIYNFILAGHGKIKDINDIPTENDMLYLFQNPEY